MKKQSTQKQYPAEYEAWRSMKKRAKKDGIQFNKGWESFEGFLAAVGKRPSEHHRLLRKNPAKGFNATNVSWVEHVGEKRIISKGPRIKAGDRVEVRGGGPGYRVLEVSNKHFQADKPTGPKIGHKPVTAIDHAIGPEDIGLGNIPDSMKEPAWCPAVITLDEVGNRCEVRYSPDGKSVQITVGFGQITIYDGGRIEINTGRPRLPLPASAFP